MGPYLFLFVLGILAGFSNQFRSQSGTGIVIFIIAFLVVNYNKGIKAKAIIGLSAILLFSCYMPAVFMKYQLNKRDNWLVHHEPGFDPVKLSGGHTIWHPLYLGLAFIENPYGIIWEDQNAFDKINSVNPGLKLNTYSIESERILKSEYLKILKNDFGFVVRCYFRKFIYVVLFLLLFFNYGLVLLFRAGISFRFLIPFFITICFYSLPGVLVWPIPHYFIGAIHLVVILFICLSADILMKPSLP
jgi:hypothetical protein